jgi:hypothetical protein
MEVGMVTSKRIENAKRAFPFIEFYEEVEVLREDWERSQFAIKGIHKATGKEVTWVSHHPGGSMPKMLLGDRKFVNATFQRAQEINTWINLN